MSPLVPSLRGSGERGIRQPGPVVDLVRSGSAGGAQAGAPHNPGPSPIAGIGGGGVVLGEVLFWLAVIAGAVGALMVEGAPAGWPARRRGFVLIGASLAVLFFLALRGWD